MAFRTETSEPSPRARLLEARHALSTAFRVLDAVGPGLPEPERGAVLTLRAEVSESLRKASNIAAFLTEMNR